MSTFEGYIYPTPTIDEWNAVLSMAGGMGYLSTLTPHNFSNYKEESCILLHESDLRCLFGELPSRFVQEIIKEGTYKLGSMMRNIIDEDFEL